MQTTVMKRTVRTQVESPGGTPGPWTRGWVGGQGWTDGVTTAVPAGLQGCFRQILPTAWVFPALLSYQCQIQVQLLACPALWPRTQRQQHLTSDSYPASLPVALPSERGLFSVARSPHCPSPAPGCRTHGCTLSFCPMSLTIPLWCPGERTNVDIQPALSELLPALDPDPPTLSLICLQLALENDRLPSLC